MCEEEKKYGCRLVKFMGLLPPCQRLLILRAVPSQKHPENLWKLYIFKCIAKLIRQFNHDTETGWHFISTFIGLGKDLQINTNFHPVTAAACDTRFCSSSVSRTRHCDSCSKSLNATNLEMQLVKRTHFMFFKVDICGHFRSAKMIQDSRQVLPNSNSCLGEPGLKFFGFACTSLTLLVPTRLSWEKNAETD